MKERSNYFMAGENQPVRVNPSPDITEELGELIQTLSKVANEYSQIPSPTQELLGELRAVGSGLLKWSRSVFYKRQT